MKLIGYNKRGQERWANFPAVHGKYELPADWEFIQVGEDWENPRDFVAVVGINSNPYDGEYLEIWFEKKGVEQ